MESASELDVRREVLRAERRIRPLIRETPLEPSPWLARKADCEVYLKLENLQATCSFKIRGAANKLLALGEPERERGIVTASTGNHASAVAHLLSRFGWRGSIFIPENASEAKVEALQLLGADLQFHGTDGVEAERRARLVAERTERVYVSPYNDPQIIGGQGTIGVELERQLPEIDAVFLPVGGGGLAAGVAGWLKSSNPSVEIIGCQPKNSAVMYESVRAGAIVDLESRPTLADGTAGGIERESLTFPICRDRIDRFILLDEDDIAVAVREVLRRHHLLIEGAAALSVAAFLRVAERYRERRVVLILSGARISLETLRAVIG
jgi:threonine dehydratase